MITALSIVLFGFILGVRHATDADHVVAVTTIVSRERKIGHAALIGGLWGIGHTVTILVAGSAILWLGVVIPKRTGLALEFSVALMLIVLGLVNLKGMVRWIAELRHHGAEITPHDDDDVAQRATTWLDRWFGGIRTYQLVRPIIVGVVHGLAGSAAVALLVLPIIHNPLWAFGYLLIFGFGTIAGMIGITVGISLPFAWSAKCSAAFHRHLGFAAGFASLGFGLFLVYQIGFVQGLFTK